MQGMVPLTMDTSAIGTCREVEAIGGNAPALHRLRTSNHYRQHHTCCVRPHQPPYAPQSLTAALHKVATLTVTASQTHVCPCAPNAPDLTLEVIRTYLTYTILAPRMTGIMQMTACAHPSKKG